MFTFNPLVYQQDELSKIFWQRYAIANTEATNTVLDDPIKDWDTFTLEVFQRLYNDPHPPQLDPILPEHKWVTVLHQHFQDQPDFHILTQKCFNDVAASGVATMTIANHLKHHIPKPSSPLKDVESIRNQARIKQTQLQQTADPDEKNQLAEELEQLKQSGKDAIAQATAYAEQLNSEVYLMMGQGVDIAITQVEQLQRAFRALGYGTGVAEPQFIPIEDKIKLAKLLTQNPLLRKIADLAGRWLDTARKSQRSSDQQPYGEIKGLELGDDLAKLTPHELTQLAVPELRGLFYHNYLQRSLLEYRCEYDADKSKGAMVLCVDNSGSMSGQRELLAKALSAALYQFCREDNRHLQVIHFSHAVTRVYDFPQNSPNPQKLLENLLSRFDGGGTNFVAPIRTAVKTICTHPGDLKEADIIFISDGDCYVSADFVEWFGKKRVELGIDCYGLLVAGFSNSMNQICDCVWQVNPQNPEQQLQELFV
jgi:uncharacterized protein with von Willebrand factor type A (vWA) domain